MRPAIHDASARQRSGGPALVPDHGGNRDDRARKPGLSDVEGEIAGLLDRSTPELRLAWRQLHRTGPPVGLSRDLIIRGLADELQQRAHGNPSRALQRRLTEWLSRSGVMLDDKGFVCAGANIQRLLETNLPGVFAIGDVRSGSVERVAAAVGEGAHVVAALHAFLAERGDRVRLHANTRRR